MKSIWITFAVVALLVVSCSAADAPEQTNRPTGTGKPEVMDKLTNVHSNQEIMQTPPSFEGAHVCVYFGGAQCYLKEDV
jgi:PBP1b-binding outer membrane lipoprotein LpoB